jgi:hypothetical protein
LYFLPLKITPIFWNNQRVAKGRINHAMELHGMYLSQVQPYLQSEEFHRVVHRFVKCSVVEALYWMGQSSSLIFFLFICLFGFLFLLLADNSL